MQPTPTTRLRLADGRLLDVWYDDAPETRGSVPLVYHPGTPASGLGFGPFTDAARRRGLQIVSWSRPGYGSSTRLPGRRVAHVAADTAAVLDHLGEEGAYVVGHSGGGPHALACAALLPDRSSAPRSSPASRHGRRTGSTSSTAWARRTTTSSAPRSAARRTWPRTSHRHGRGSSD